MMRTGVFGLTVLSLAWQPVGAQSPDPGVREALERLESEYPQQAVRAYNRLFEQATGVARPDREAEREKLSRQLVEAFGASKSAMSRGYLARLLGMIGRDEAVDALAGALADKDVGDGARRALIANPSPSATRALEAAAASAEGDRLIALLNALGARADASSREWLVGVARSGDESIRLAAVDALARIPDEKSDSVIAAAATSGSQRGRDRAWRARLQLAESLLAADRRTEANVVFRKAREAARSAHQRRAAISGLDRIFEGGPRSRDMARRNGGLTFRIRRLAVDSNEGCAVADVNRDGYLDVIAGPRWYEGPEFTPHRLRDLDTSDEFTANNGDHAYDVNGDGWVDVISGNWFDRRVFWYEHPGPEGLAKGELWTQHPLINGRNNNEAYFLHDIDGDRVPEILVDCWDESAPVVAWKIKPAREAGYESTRHVPGNETCGHGMAIGDVNGDGRDDIVVGKGWYEAPPENALETSWTFHGGFELGHCSTPCLVVDVNRDGLADIIYGQGHDYGLAWYEQTKTDDGGRTWVNHEIDDSFAQAHTMALADLDGDGDDELITGKRVRGHAGNDPGAADPTCLFRYVWNADTQTFVRYTIAYDNGVGTGMQINIADFDMDGALDIAVAGKTGTYVLMNQRFLQTAAKR